MNSKLILEAKVKSDVFISLRHLTFGIRKESFFLCVPIFIFCSQRNENTQENERTTTTGDKTKPNISNTQLDKETKDFHQQSQEV